MSRFHSWVSVSCVRPLGSFHSTVAAVAVRVRGGRGKECGLRRSRLALDKRKKNRSLWEKIPENNAVESTEHEENNQ